MAIRYNDFHSDLAYSLEAREDESLNAFYVQAFPTAEKVEFCEDLDLQKKGIDKIVYFPNGRTVTIDEKKRRKDYGDILLEIRSNKERNTPGWLFYSQCDYIVYAILPAGRAYLLPTLLLQMAWKKHGKIWLSSYPVKLADNRLYHTENIAIPTDVLLEAVKSEMKQKVGA